jgi:excisionase family DNA binding protein
MRNRTRSRRAPASPAPVAPAALAGADAPARPRRAPAVTFASLPPPSPLLHTVDDVQAILRVGRNTVYRLVAAGKLQSVSITRDAMRITDASIKALIAAPAAPAVPAPRRTRRAA